jgi:hypothetical protein
LYIIRFIQEYYQLINQFLGYHLELFLVSRHLSN